MFRRKYADEISTLDKLIQRKEQTADYILNSLKNSEVLRNKTSPRFSGNIIKPRLLRNIAFIAVSIILVLAVISKIWPDFHNNGKSDKDTNPGERRLISINSLDKPAESFAVPTGNEFFLSNMLQYALEKYEGQEEVYFDVMIKFILPYGVDEKKADELTNKKVELLNNLGVKLEPVGQKVDNFSYGFNYCAKLNSKMINELKKHGGFALKFNSSKSQADFNQEIYDAVSFNFKISQSLKDILSYSGKEELVSVDVFFNRVNENQLEKELDKILGYRIEEVEEEYKKNPALKDEFKEKLEKYEQTRVQLLTEKHKKMQDDFLDKYPHLKNRVISKPELFPIITLELNYQEILELSEDKSVESIDFYPEFIVETFSE